MRNLQTLLMYDNMINGVPRVLVPVFSKVGHAFLCVRWGSAL